MLGDKKDGGVAGRSIRKFVLFDMLIFQMSYSHICFMHGIKKKAGWRIIIIVSLLSYFRSKLVITFQHQKKWTRK